MRRGSTLALSLAAHAAALAGLLMLAPADSRILSPPSTVSFQLELPAASAAGLAAPPATQAAKAPAARPFAAAPTRTIPVPVPAPQSLDPFWVPGTPPPVFASAALVLASAAVPQLGEALAESPHGAATAREPAEFATAAGRSRVDAEAVRWAVDAAALYPEFARRRGLEGAVRVRFQLLVGGALSDLTVIESAGTLLDRAALAAVRAAAPFISPPGWVVVPVVFRLDAAPKAAPKAAP